MNTRRANRHARPGRALARARIFALRATCAVLCVAPFAGCTVGPNYALPQDALVNAKFANAPIDGASDPLVTQQPVPPNWWRLYDDPVLNGLVEDALAENRDLKVAVANLAASRAEVQFAREQDGFSGDAAAAVQYTQLSPQAFLTDKIPPSMLADVGFNVSYELDLFGKLRRGVEAAKADDDAVEAALDLVRVTVVAEVVRSYVENCAAAEELAIAQRSLALERERVDVSRQLLQAGRGNLPDVTRGLTQQDTIAAEIPRFQLRQRVAQYQLAMLLARAPDDLPPDAKNCTKLPQIGQPVPVGDGAALLKRRPDVREAERKLAASTARIGVATAALYPTISIGASAGFTGFPKDLGTAQTARYAIGPLISWVFPVNGQRARVHEAEASTAASLAQFDSVVLNALRETQSALATYSEDTARWQALQTAAQSAQKSADETHQLYVSGRESFISDLDATRTLTSVDAQVAAARSIVAVDRVNLFLALGGGWEEAAPDGAKEGSNEASPQSPQGGVQQTALKSGQQRVHQTAQKSGQDDAPPRARE
ncbi:efflux transporter outer membrane subunit [Paraburkholderia humisilvae]|uniref:Outer membrane protein OprM n=1 Tax=Paraburkholderia humisilvae TaxID=627669 RepID=A0A6J5EX20_9BURK|nr:efflux transporter outer membrane subunit [Paraburkholderia humisilvae]CAB3769951.1 Outer membrane protein OprM [Paraburkholderia humisilvae]